MSNPQMKSFGIMMIIKQYITRKTRNQTNQQKIRILRESLKSNLTSSLTSQWKIKEATYKYLSSKMSFTKGGELQKILYQILCLKKPFMFSIVTKTSTYTANKKSKLLNLLTNIVFSRIQKTPNWPSSFFYKRKNLLWQMKSQKIQLKMWLNKNNRL